MFSICRFFIILLCVCVVLPVTLQADPVISVDVEQFETELNTGDIEDHIFNIFNEGDEELRFTIDHVIIGEPDRDQNMRSERSINGNGQFGPRRDDLGDEVAQFNVGNRSWSGIAWDGELMWGIGQERMIAFNPEEAEVVENVNLRGWHMGLAYDGEFFWSGSFADNDEMAMIQRIDRDGNVNQTLAVQGMAVSGIAYDGENLWYHSLVADPNGRFDVIIRQMTTEGEQLREINCNNLFEGFSLSLAYVPEHEDGNLWVIIWENSAIYQLDISGDAPEIVQQTQIVGNQGNQDQTYGLEHDGENMWYCNGSEIWYVIDDGVRENRWLTYEPDAGALEAGGDLDVAVTLDAAGLIEGVYEADIHIISNDPDNNDVVINVIMDITGVPFIEVIWDEEVGFPDVINWNEGYLDLFPEVAYPIEVTIENLGTAVLEVAGISCEAGVFRAEPDNFNLDPGEEIVVTFILEADNEGVYESEMVIDWNSTDGEDYLVHLLGRTSLPPQIEADLVAIETNLVVGAVEEHIVNISNIGNSTLRFTIEREIISEPELDNNLRSFGRRVNDQSGPRRDDLGDIIAEHRVGNWVWSGIAWDGELMWGISPDTRDMIAFDPETEEVVENFGFDPESYGMAYDGESFWVGSMGGDNDWMARLIRIDRNGDVGQIINTQGWMITGVTFDGENLWYYSMGDAEPGNGAAIRQITLEGEQIREVNCRDLLNGGNLSIAYVPEHEGGNLWVLDWESRELYQLDISGEEAEVMQQTRINGANVFGLEHDGENLWYCTINDIWYVLDDGIRESLWLTSDPEEGQLEPAADTDIFVTLDATELIEGIYEADMHILSNDPNTPDLIVSVLMNVGPTSVPGKAIITADYHLSAAFPNPFNSTTKIEFGLPEDGLVKVSIYDGTGRLVSVECNEQLRAGIHAINWQAGNNPAGIYLIEMSINDFRAVEKVILMK